MVEEYASIMQNDVWEVVPRPAGKSMITSRWLYKVKYVADGNIEKYKARFVAQGFSQIEGIDYNETFAPVARYASIRSVISIAAEMGWKIDQMDVKIAFLHGVIEEEIYLCCTGTRPPLKTLRTLRPGVPGTWGLVGDVPKLSETSKGTRGLFGRPLTVP